MKITIRSVQLIHSIFDQPHTFHHMHQPYMYCSTTTFCEQQQLISTSINYNVNYHFCLLRRIEVTITVLLLVATVYLVAATATIYLANIYRSSNAININNNSRLDDEIPILKKTSFSFTVERNNN